MTQLAFRFDPAPAPPIDTAPKWFKIELDKKGWSYGHIGVMRNDDGTWSYTTKDNFGGYCGHGGPFWGAYESFEAALEIAATKMHRSWLSISQRTNDSCCGDNHRAMARKGMAWLDALAAEYGIQLRTDA